MPVNLPYFSPGNNLAVELATAKLNALSQAIGEQRISVGKGLSMRAGPTGIIIEANPAFVRSLTPDLRCYVAKGASSTDIGSGAVCVIDSITYDIGDATTETDSKLLTLSGGSLTFLQQGTYLCTYHAALKVNIGGADSEVTETNTGKTLLRAGGTELAETAGYFGAEQKPNFKRFLKKDNDEPFEPTVDLTDLVTYTEIITPIPVVDGETLPTVTSDLSDAIATVEVAYGAVWDETFGVGGAYPVVSGFVDIGFASGLDPTGTPSVDTTPSNAVTNVVLNDVSAIDVLPATCLEVDGRLKATADADTSADFSVTTGGVTALEEPAGGMTGNAMGGTSGCALISVVWSTDDSALKINLDGTMVDPTIDVFGSREGAGGRALTVENLTLSILKIS